MKFKKIATLIAGLGLLCSCSGNSYIGVYSFGMGRATSTSFDVSMELTNEPFETTIERLKEKQPKYFDFNFTITGMSEDYFTNQILEVINLLKDPDTDTFRGFYYVEPQMGKSTNQLCIGFQGFISILEELKELTGLDIDFNVFEKVVFCTIDGKNIEMAIPVSLADLCFQLAWYGFYVSPVAPTFNNIHILDFKDEEDKHTPNYNVTDKDVEKMNNDFAAYFCNSVVNYEGNNVAGLFVDESDRDNPKTKLLYYPEYIGEVDDLDGKVVTIIDAQNNEIECILNLASGDIVRSITLTDGVTDITSLVPIEEKTVYRKTHVVHLGLQKE